MRLAIGAVPPRALDRALEPLRSGGELRVVTYLKHYRMTKRTLEQFERLGAWLLREDGDGYRMRTGKHSVYLFPGQLQAR